jgi:phosphoenolpyruvate synthase/pyruvate phosphate dikinase
MAFKWVYKFNELESAYKPANNNREALQGLFAVKGSLRDMTRMHTFLNIGLKDTQLTAADWQLVTSQFKTTYRSNTKVFFPQQPLEHHYCKMQDVEFTIVRGKLWLLCNRDGEFVAHAQFFSCNTNDLTQTTFGISRDEAKSGILIKYREKGILTKNLFAALDRDGVTQLILMGVMKGRRERPDLGCGIFGGHGGDLDSILHCRQMEHNYVSCSPFRVPVARLAAAHAALNVGRTGGAPCLN